MKTLLCLLPLAVLALVGCSTDTGDSDKDRAGRITNAVLKNVGEAVGKAAFDELAARVSDPDHAHSAASGLWKEGLWKAGFNLVNSNLVAEVVAGYSGRSLPNTAAVAAAEFRAAGPVTTDEQKAVISAIAAAISEAVTSEAAP